MGFTVGETVVYPHHGAAKIEAVETRTVKGEERLYLVLKVAQGDLTVRVPADNAEYVGVRDVVDAEGLERNIAGILTEDAQAANTCVRLHCDSIPDRNN